MILTAATILVTTGAGIYHPALDIDDMAAEMVAACGDGPRRFPAGSDCLKAVAAVWHTETAGTFSHHPRPRGTGCGALQVVPRSRWGNVRLGYWATPPCGELTWRLATAMRWGVLILRAKAMRTKKVRSMFRLYNGSSRADRYADRAMRIWGKGSSLWPKTSEPAPTIPASPSP